MKISFRTPNEFYGFGYNHLQSLKLWAFHKWYDCDNGLYRQAGIRILGIEISYFKIKYFDY